MSLGYERELVVVNLDDTAVVHAYVYDGEETLIPEDDISTVDFIIQKPSGNIDTVAGTVSADGQGSLQYNNTDEIGHYTTIASFATAHFGKRSSRSDFEVIDPLAPAIPAASYVAAYLAWEKLEDCFDGEDEGPWLRDMTLNYFNKDKMEKFMDEAMFDINIQHPPTALDLGSFIATPDVNDPNQVPQPTEAAPLLAQGILVSVVRHLVRSYTEQPNPVGAQIAWHDRRDYMQRWQEVYAIEQEQYKRMLALYKRQFLGLGSTRLLVGSKSGRMFTAPMRTRSAGRGWW